MRQFSFLLCALLLGTYSILMVIWPFLTTNHFLNGKNTITIDVMGIH